jgi:hypothetical protein
MIEVRFIENRAEWLDWRADDMTASVGACLFGDDLLPTTSAYQQWALKSGLWKPRAIDPKLARRAAAVEWISPNLIRQERPDWEVGVNEDYYRDPDENIGATPDLIARRPDIEGTGNIQVKSIGMQAFRRWKDRDTGETLLPVWIGIQTNIEAAFMRATWAAVAAITIGDHGLDVEIIDVELVPEVMATFRELAREFWRRVREKDPYPIDWGRDAAVILDMYAGGGPVIDLTGNPMAEIILMQREDFQRLEAEGTEAQKRRRTLDAQLIRLMGNASAARVGSRLVRAKVVKVKEAVRKAYSYPRITIVGHEAREPDSSRDDDAA